MLKSLKDLLAIMQADPSISGELPKARRLILKTFGWLLATEFLLVAQLYPIKFFIDELGKPQPSLQWLLGIALVTVIVYLAGAETKRRMNLWREATFWRLWSIWWGYGHRRELRLSTDWHVRHSTGEKESLVSKNIERLQTLVDELLFGTLPVILRIVITTLLMFTIGWYFGAVALLTGVVYVMVLWRSDKHLQPLRKAFLDEIKPIERFGTEITVNWRTIKTIGREEDFSDKNDEMLRSFCQHELLRTRLSEGRMIMQDRVVILSRGLLYLMIGLTTLWQDVSLGSVALALTWMETAYANLWGLTNFQRQLNQGLEAMRELVAVMCLPPTVRQAEVPLWPERMKGEVAFETVSFTYPEGAQPAVRGIDLTVRPYSSVALVGSSGCGKTTLMSLLQREYDPTEGRITIDGLDLAHLDYNRYRREMIGVVSQQVQLFDGTILDNIRITQPDATEEEVVEAARLANAHEFIVATERGYHTKVGENGIRLSGGQRQRLAIARALLRRPAILIMDEATSSLDAVSQDQVQETIDRLIAERRCTIFIIAHRFSTIMSADVVAVIDDGRIAELGTHAELARMNGLYTRLRSLETRGLLD